VSRPLSAQKFSIEKILTSVFADCLFHALLAYSSFEPRHKLIEVKRSSDNIEHHGLQGGFEVFVLERGESVTAPCEEGVQQDQRGAFVAIRKPVIAAD
jgi:hypothetical protein